MQRPLHAQIHRPNTNPPPLDDQTYVPTYGAIPAGTNPEYAAYPSYSPVYRTPRTPAPERKLPPVIPKEKERIVPAQVKPRKRSLSRRDTEKHLRPVYEAPVTYGAPLSPSTPRHRRRASEPSRRIVEGNSKIVNAQRDSLAYYGSDHVFVSLSSRHILKILHLPRTISDSVVRDGLVQAWPDGIRKESRTSSSWVIKFKGHPWSADGELGFYGHRLVCRLFELLGNGGYSYVSSINAANCSHSATLVFAITPTYFISQYFTVSFSRSRHEVYVIDAPRQLVPIITGTIRKAFNDSSEGSLVADGVYGIRLSQGGQSIHSQDIPPRLAPMLQAVGSHGFRLEATVQMVREGFLGLLGRKDVWIFRSNFPIA